MARRGRKARLDYNSGPGYQAISKADAFKIAKAIASAGGRKKRGPNKARASSSSMSDSEFIARQAEASALLGNSQRKSRGGFFSKVRKSYKKVRRSMARGRKGNQSQSYTQVTSSIPIQVSIEVAELLFTGGSVLVDVYTAATKSTADDTAFPIITRVLSSAGRYGAQKFLSRKHPGLAATVAHGFSAMNGDRNGNFMRNTFRKYLTPKGDGPSNP